jgi:DNA-directed RNA polymerase specialized sigma24 family protein
MNMPVRNETEFEKLLREIQPIIDKAARKTLNTVKAADLEDIRQEVRTKLFKNIDKIKAPYSWARKVTQNYCIDKFIKKKQPLLLNDIDESRQNDQDKGAGQFNDLADRKSIERGDFTAVEDQFTQLVKKDYKIKVDQKSLQLREILETSLIRNSKNKLRPIVSDVVQNLLAETMVDKEEYNFPEAEKKLRALIRFLENKRSTTESRYLRAKARFELGHLRMNHGFASGTDGSIFWYEKAARDWRNLNDNLNELYTLEQIGVSHSIRGDRSEAIKIFDSLLKVIPRKKDFKLLTGNIWCDRSSTLLKLGHTEESDKSIRRSLEYSGDSGGKALLFSRRQKAQVSIENGKCSEAYKLLKKCINETRPYEALDYIKNNIALFDLYKRDNQMAAALNLVPDIRAKCIDNLFHDELQELESRLT